MIVYGYGVLACMNEPGIWDIIKKNLHELHTVAQPDGYILGHDEMRHQGWDASCQKANRTMAQTLADNVQRCVALIKTEDPDKPIYAWSDMFEPFHNAGKTGQTYYLVKGIDPWYGAWEGMDQDVIILNWHGFPDKRADALKFFADRGHRQILCGYYDAPCENVIPWLKEAAQVKGVVGVMYTTWCNDFNALEKFADIVNKSRP